MQILINNCDVDIQLENEENTLQVAESISEWAKERELIFVEANIDGNIYLPEEIPEQKLNEVELFNCNIQSKSDLILSSISEGITYCDRVVKYINDSIDQEKFDVEELKLLYTGIEWLKEMLSSVFQLLGLELTEIKYMDHKISEYIDQLDITKNELSKLTKEKEVLEYLDTKKEFFVTFHGIFKMLLLSDNIKNLIVQSIDSPDKIIDSIKEMKNQLPDQLENLANVAIAFQEGKDQEGSEKLQVFVDFIYMFVRVTYQVAPLFKIDLSTIIIDDVSFEDKNNDINQLLQEIVEVMENNDIISLSDILEYEMKPIMENAGDYLDLVLEKIS